jgi:hypothetical protein
MARFETMRRSRDEAMVAQGYANDGRTLQELGPVGMWTRNHVMMPLLARFIERALNDVDSARARGSRARERGTVERSLRVCRDP